MNVTFENIIIVYRKKIAEVLIGLVNQIIFAFDEDTLRRLVANYAEASELDRYFVYGYGRHHFWLAQRKFTDSEKNYDHRILIVKF